MELASFEELGVFSDRKCICCWSEAIDGSWMNIGGGSDRIPMLASVGGRGGRW